eukprot:606550-Pelagomonas_calceolata.AAC.1
MEYPQPLPPSRAFPPPHGPSARRLGRALRRVLVMCLEPGKASEMCLEPGMGIRNVPGGRDGHWGCAWSQGWAFG